MRRCLDTTFLSDLIRGKAEAVEALEDWVAEGDEMVTTSINWYEVGVGIACEPTVRARRLAEAWKEVSARLHCAVLSPISADVAAARQAELFARGRPASTSDLLIAAMAFSHDCDVIVTRDEEDFRRIGLVKVVAH